MKDDDADQARDIETRRALLMQAAAIERRWNIEKPPVYIPYTLHPFDEQQLSKHFRIVYEMRPTP